MIERAASKSAQRAEDLAAAAKELLPHICCFSYPCLGWTGPARCTRGAGASQQRDASVGAQLRGKAVAGGVPWLCPEPPIPGQPISAFLSGSVCCHESYGGFRQRLDQPRGAPWWPGYHRCLTGPIRVHTDTSGKPSGTVSTPCRSLYGGANFAYVVRPVPAGPGLTLPGGRFRCRNARGNLPAAHFVNFLKCLPPAAGFAQGSPLSTPMA